MFNYEPVAWMKHLKDKNSGLEYYQLGVMQNMKDTFAVTPMGSDGRTLFWCVKHEIAYPIHEACPECRMQVREVATEASVTSCDTPEIQRD